MKTLALLRTLGPVDWRNWRRDALLLWLPLLPLVIALLLRTAVPLLARTLLADYGVDLRPYFPLVFSLYFVFAPTLGGLITGFLLLDERDDGVLQVWQVMPLPLGSYLAYRVVLPLALGFVMTVLGYPLLGAPPLATADLLIIALLAAFCGPQMALFLAGFAGNKVEGFALMKGLNGAMALALVGYFLAEPWLWVAGVLPTFWPLKVFWLAAAGEPYGVAASVGLVVNGAAVWLLLRRVRLVLQR